MNKSRRSRIDAIIEQAESLAHYIDAIREEEETAYYNMPESFQESERGELMYEAIDYLEDAISSLEEVTDYLNSAKGD